MSTGPLRRTTGAIGLLALVPIVLHLATGALSPEEAAARGLVVALVTLAVGHVAQRVVRTTLRRFEGEVHAEDLAVTADAEA